MTNVIHKKKYRTAESGPIWIENIYFCHFSAKNPKIALSEENQLGIRFNFALQKILFFGQKRAFKAKIALSEENQLGLKFDFALKS